MQQLLERIRRALEMLLARGNLPDPIAGAVNSVRFLTLVGIEFYQERCFYMASTLSFSAAFALVPVSTFYFSLFAAFPGFRELIFKARAFILEQLVPQSNMKEEVIRYFNELTSHVYGLTSISVLALVFTSVMLFITIEDSLNKIFAVRQPPPLQRSLVMYTNLLFWGPILMGLSAFLWFESLRFTPVSWLALSDSGHFALTFALSWTMFAATYWLLPYGHTAVGPSLLGGLVAAALWEVAKRAFSLYLQHAFVYSRVYGSIGFIPVSLLWIYLSSLIFLFGAQVSFCWQFRAMLQMLGHEGRVPVLLTQTALASLLLIGRRFRRGEPPPTIYELSAAIKVPSYVVQSALLALAEKRILHSVTRRGDTFLPARSLEAITLREAFWATYPRTPPLAGDAPEVRYVDGLVEQSHDAISGVLRNRTVAEVLDETASWKGRGQSQGPAAPAVAREAAAGPATTPAAGQAQR
jgi:YihY family inner membrane protein